MSRVCLFAKKLLCIRPQVYHTSTMLVPRKSLQTCLFLYEAVIFHSTRRKTAALKRLLCWINTRRFSVSLPLSMYGAVAVTSGLRDCSRFLSETNSCDWCLR